MEPIYRGIEYLFGNDILVNLDRKINEIKLNPTETFFYCSNSLIQFGFRLGSLPLIYDGIQNFSVSPVVGVLYTGGAICLNATSGVASHLDQRLIEGNKNYEIRKEKIIKDISDKFAQRRVTNNN